VVFRPDAALRDDLGGSWIGYIATYYRYGIRALTSAFVQIHSNLGGIPPGSAVAGRSIRCGGIVIRF